MALVTASPAVVAEPAVVFELGGKNDKSFGQSAAEGAERWKRETGKLYLEFEIQNAAQREQAIRRFAERGANPVVGVGFPQASAIEKVARDFPKTSFAIVDMVVPLPNVQSFVYREHEGAFLAGLLAVLASKTGTIGFVGGQDIPLVRKVLCGYEQGAHHADPKARVVSAMTGSTNAAWTDPVRGAELARAQAAQGADVIFAAAGSTGLGVLQAAADLKILGIGVDSNQNGLHPGQMLTSMLKRTDVAVFSAFGGVRPGVTELGLKEDGLALAFDEHNAALVTKAMRARVDAARADIVAGRITVVDWTVAKRCL
ncbi:MAG: BMP family ABC transporter substrate-binding protein [Rubrivivax sp.]